MTIVDKKKFFVSSNKKTKNKMILYVTENYNKFKLFLEIMYKKKIIPIGFLKYASNLTPKEFTQEINKLSDKKYNSFEKKIIEYEKSLKKMKGGARMSSVEGKKSAIMDCSQNKDDEVFKVDEDGVTLLDGSGKKISIDRCYVCPLTLDCLDDDNVIQSPNNDRTCFNKDEFCRWININGRNPMTNLEMNNAWIQENCGLNVVPPQPYLDDIQFDGMQGENVILIYMGAITLSVGAVSYFYMNPLIAPGALLRLSGYLFSANPIGGITGGRKRKSIKRTKKTKRAKERKRKEKKGGNKKTKRLKKNKEKAKKQRESKKTKRKYKKNKEKV